MKILLAAVNACYNHTNLAVRSLALFADKPQTVGFGEWTINQPPGDILRGIAAYSPDIVLFSTYIWNAELVQKIIPDVKKILPDCVIGAGGPEAGFCAEGYLNKFDALDLVIFGEGEQTVREIADVYTGQTEKSGGIFNAADFLKRLAVIKGIFMRSSDGSGKVVFTGERSLLCSLAELPFPYSVIDDPDNRIYYYESSRGCPFSCAYCMSSLDKRVRFLPLERVFSDLQRFLDAGVKLVKFVDRTYNLQDGRYILIWQYILDHHNNKTMFHFEIEAEFLSEEALVFLQKVPEGVMQFEIGVQSSNPHTLGAVCRSQNTQLLAENISRIPRTIHCHLDLIAGLPFEDLKSFGNSFDFTMALKPDALQIGFLKVLHGTSMEDYCMKNGWKWMENPPYETLSTPYLDYKDMMFLKDVETLVDVYWNSGSFCRTMEYIGRTKGFWNFFYMTAEKAGTDGVFDVPHRESYWFEYLAASCSDRTFQELLKFDFIKSGKKGGFPQWYNHNYSKERHRLALEKNGGVKNARLDFAYSDYEEFSINPFAEEPEKTAGKTCVLFLYGQRSSGICSGRKPAADAVFLQEL